MKEEIRYGKQKIEFDLIYMDRKTLGITVHPDRSVEVKAPADASREKIFQKVRSRASWIVDQRRYFASFEPRRRPFLYKSGESHYYLGRQYLLKIRTPEAAVDQGLIRDTVPVPKKGLVHYHRNHLMVITTDPSPTRVRSLLEDWYQGRARIKFGEYAAPLIERFRDHGVEPRDIQIRKMKTRWGSCSTRGTITLNPDLIKAPKACIEYVILHELCHLIHRNHTAEFFALLSREMPDWEKWKEKLERFMA